MHQVVANESMDMVEVAEAVHASGERDGPVPPFKYVGLALHALLKSGHLRRELAKPPAVTPATFEQA